MRRLLGQVHSFDEAIRLGILPGSRSVDKAKIPRLGPEVLRGLVLLTGGLPIGHFNPGAHHFVHFGGYTYIYPRFAFYSMDDGLREVQFLLEELDSKWMSS